MSGSFYFTSTRSRVDFPMASMNAGKIGRRLSSQRGLSLVELMISLTIGLFLVVGLAVLFSSMSSTRNELDKSSRQIENGRYAIQLLSEGVRHAGYYGSLVSAPTLPVAMTLSTLPDPCSTDLSDVQDSIGLPLRGYAGAATVSALDGGKLVGCLDNYQPNTAVLVVRRANTSVLGYTSGVFNIQVSACAGDTATYVIAAASSAFTLHTNTAATACDPLSAANVADITPYLTHIYFVSSCSVCTGGSADSLPTLKRIDVNSGGTVTTALVEGIENIQFDYGIDSTLDGVPDSYTNTTGHAATVPADLTEWQNVMTLRIHVLARNLDQTAGYTDPKTYSLGPASSAPGGAYKRHAYSELVRINNPAGRRE